MPHLTRKRHLFIPYNGKIADITHADTNHHFLTGLAALLGETRKIIAIEVIAARAVGTGQLQVYPNEGSFAYVVQSGYTSGYIAIKDNSDQIEYKLTVANDDFDLNCFGYVVEL